jgi:hypothetical protein
MFKLKSAFHLGVPIGMLLPGQRPYPAESPW